jgi:ATP-binding cassette subfamily B protein
MNRIIFKTILAICKDYWLPLAAVLAVGISQTFVGMYSLVYFQRLLDGFPAARQLADLLPLLVGYIGLTALNHVLIYLEGYPTSILNAGAVQWVKLKAMRKIASIDFLAYENMGTGNLIQVIENGAEAARNILSGFYLNIVRGILPQLVISLLFIRYYDQSLFLLILGGYGVFYVLSYSLMKFLRGEMEKMLSNKEDFSKFSVRAFMELVIFRINGRYKAEFERVKQISDEIVRSRAKVYLLQELFYTGFAFMVFVIEAGVVTQQAIKILAGASTVGTLVALVSFIRMVFGPITSFSMAYMGYKLDVVTFKRFYQFDTLPDDPGLAQGRGITVPVGQIELRDISFAYPEHAVLEHFQLAIEGGKMTAFVGESGGGKSTLMRLILYLLKPQAGQVFVDGQDLAGANLASYYREVAYIPQEPPVFDGTLQENLAFDRPADPARVAEVIRLVKLEELVHKMPAGLQTLIGERGIKLSGGERQRLAFGRVLLQNPKIIILDEPTSALDSLTEHLITQNMMGMLKGKTVIVVAHRLQTIKGADRIIVFEEGTAIQDGCFEELMAGGGRFRELWDKQTEQQMAPA